MLDDTCESAGVDSPRASVFSKPLWDAALDSHVGVGSRNPDAPDETQRVVAVAHLCFERGETIPGDICEGCPHAWGNADATDEERDWCFRTMPTDRIARTIFALEEASL